MGKSVWLVAHFAETFSDCQTMLENHEIDYFIETESISSSWFRDHSQSAGSQVHLLLGDLVKPLVINPDEPDLSSVGIAMMVVERHPFGPRDDHLIEFANSLPAKVEVGYFLALEDLLVQRMVPPQMIDLLKAMGLQDRDLISSSMVTTRLRKLIQRSEKDGQPFEGVDSAEQWFKMQDASS